MIWVPSALHTVMCIVAALFVSFIIVGFIALVGGLLGYPLTDTPGVIAYIISSVFVFGFLICINEDPDLK